MQLAHRQGRATASTASRTSSIPMPTPARWSPTPTWCCRTRPTSNASTRSACSTGRSPTPTAPPMRSATRCSTRRRSGADGRPRDVRGFQSVLLDLGARLGLPGMVDAQDGAPKYRDYADYIVRHERAPGVGLLAGWRGADGDAATARARRTRSSSQRYIAQRRLLARARSRSPRATSRWPTATTWNGRRAWASSASTEPIVLQLYSETLQKFRLAAQGHGRRASRREATASASRPTSIRCRSGTSRSSTTRPVATPIPLNAVTQRPMFMYHAWGSQNAWLRQIADAQLPLPASRHRRRHGIADEDWIDVSSHHGTITVQAQVRRATCSPTPCGAGTRSASASGAWRLAKDAPEAARASCSTT